MPHCCYTRRFFRRTNFHTHKPLNRNLKRICTVPKCELKNAGNIHLIPFDISIFSSPLKDTEGCSFHPELTREICKSRSLVRYICCNTHRWWLQLCSHRPSVEQNPAAARTECRHVTESVQTAPWILRRIIAACLYSVLGFRVQIPEPGCLDYYSFFSPSPWKAISSTFTIYSTVVTVRTTGFIINRSFHFAHSLYLCVFHEFQNEKGLLFCRKL